MKYILSKIYYILFRIGLFKPKSASEYEKTIFPYVLKNKLCWYCKKEKQVFSSVLCNNCQDLKLM